MSKGSIIIRTEISLANLVEVEFGRRKMTARFAKRIEDACGIGTEWLLHGDEDAKYHPCGQRMTSFLKKHPEARKIVWEIVTAPIFDQKSAPFPEGSFDDEYQYQEKIHKNYIGNI